APDWLECGETLALFARDPALARRRLHAFVVEGAADSPGETGASGLWAEIETALASPSVESLGPLPRAKGSGVARRQPARAPMLAAVIDAVARAVGVDRRALVGPTRARAASRARGFAGLLAQTTGAGTLSALARATGRDPGSISRAVEAARREV